MLTKMPMVFWTLSFQSINFSYEWRLVEDGGAEEHLQVSNQLISPTSGDLVIYNTGEKLKRVSNQLISPTSGDASGVAYSFTLEVVSNQLISPTSGDAMMVGLGGAATGFPIN